MLEVLIFLAQKLYFKFRYIDLNDYVSIRTCLPRTQLMANINRGESIPKTNNPKDFFTFAINSMMIVPVTMPRSIGYTKNRIGIIPTPNITTK